MSGERRLRVATKNLDTKKRNRDQIYSGLLGTPFDGEEAVEVSGRTDFVWVRLHDDQSQLIQAFNRVVAPIYDYPVLVRRRENNPSVYEVFDVDKERYLGQMGSTNAVPRHAPQHMFNPDAIGGDIVWVYDRQIMPLLVHPSGTAGAGNAVIEPDVYYVLNSWRYGGGTGTADLLSYKPTGTSTARMVLVYLDGNTNPALIAGNEFDASITGIAQVLPHIPGLPTTSGVPLAGVRLVSGTAQVLWDNLYDLRPFIVADGFIPTGSSGHLIRWNDSDQTNRPALNFKGNLVTVVDDGGDNETEIIISGSSADGHTILDEGTPVTQRSKLDFQGDIVFVVDNPGNDATDIIFSGSAGGGGTYASLPEAQAGTLTTKKVNPYGLPVRVVNQAFVRRDGYGGNTRGFGAVDLQRKRANVTQVASGDYAMIGGGGNNRSAADYGTIGGGRTNNLETTSPYSSVLGGYDNDINNSPYAAILGGKNNDLRSSTGASILGGVSHYVSGSSYSLIGGLNQTVYGSEFGAFFGKNHDLYNSPYSLISGYNNYIADSPYVFAHGYAHGVFYSSPYGMLIGKAGALSSGTFGVATGKSAYGSHYGVEARQIRSIGFTTNQRVQLLFSGETSSATPKELFLDQNEVHRALIPANTAWTFHIIVSAKRNDTTGEAAAYEFKGLINRDATAGSTAIVGSVTKVVLAETTAAWDCGVTADSTNAALVITVTGENAKTIHWFASVHMAQAQ